MVLPNPVQPHSEGEVRLVSADVADAPLIDLNYLDDPHDVTVMLAVIRRALEIVEQLARRRHRAADGPACAGSRPRPHRRATYRVTRCWRTWRATTR